MRIYKSTRQTNETYLTAKVAFSSASLKFGTHNHRLTNTMFEQTFENIDDILYKDAGCCFWVTLQTSVDYS